VLDRAQENRDRALSTGLADFERRQGRVEAKRNQAVAEMATWRTQKLAELKQRYAHEVKSLEQKHQNQVGEAKKRFEEARAGLEHRWYDGLRQVQAPIGDVQGSNGNGAAKWGEPSWKTWKPPRQFPRDVRLGELEVDLKRFAQDAAHDKPMRLKVPEAFSVPTTPGVSAAGVVDDPHRSRRPRGCDPGHSRW
jgi:hypothetical protein